MGGAVCRCVGLACMRQRTSLAAFTAASSAGSMGEYCTQAPCARCVPPACPLPPNIPPRHPHLQTCNCTQLGADYKALKDLIKESAAEEASAGGVTNFSPRTTSLTVQRAADRRDSGARAVFLVEVVCVHVR